MWLLLFVTLNLSNPISIKDYSLVPYSFHTKAECDEEIKKTKELNPNGKFLPICFKVEKKAI